MGSGDGVGGCVEAGLAVGNLEGEAPGGGIELGWIWLDWVGLGWIVVWRGLGVCGFLSRVLRVGG